VVAHADKPILHVTSGDEWEAWLDTRPTDEGVRLRLRKKSSTRPGITYDVALDVALCHGWIDDQRQAEDADYFLQAFTPRRSQSPWSKVNREHVARLVAAGRMRPAGQAEVDRAKADGRWAAAYRMSDADVPEELRAALDTNPAAATAFASLSSQNRFAFVYRVANLKRAETRQRKAAEFAVMLEQGMLNPTERRP
jgi:uncharacterized protein YdeI (YjbR/CyaY-like superfamily)